MSLGLGIGIDNFWASAGGGSWKPFLDATGEVMFWFIPESLTGAQNAEINLWTDQSPSGNDAASSDGSRPTTQVNYFDGFSAAYMFGNRFFRLGDIEVTGAAGYDFFAVVDFDGCTVSDKLFDSGTARTILGTDASTNYAVHDGAYNSFGAIQAGVALYHFSLYAEELAIYRNGVKLTKTAGDGTYDEKSMGESTRLGAQYSASGAWDGGPLVELGGIKEGSADVADVIAYFERKYASLTIA